MARSVVTLLLLTGSVDAAAYLDPGTGSLILQGIIATIAVVGMTIKTYWYRITSWFGGNRGSKSLLDDEESDKEPDA